MGSAAFGLLLFVCGSNFCLLSVLAGGSMSCLTAPGATTAGKSHCGHALPGPASSNHATPDSGSPCCVTIAPVQSLQIQKADAGEIHVALPLAEIRMESWRGDLRVGLLPEQKPPPEAPPPARVAGRAPPLA